MSTDTTPSTAPVAIDHLEGLLAYYRGLIQEVKDLEELRDRVKRTIVEALGDRDAGTVANRVVVRNTRIVQHRLSTVLVREHFTEDQLTGCYQDVVSNRLTMVTP